MKLAADDYVYRFVAVTIGGEPNTRRIEQMIDRGWEPVPPGEWPVEIDSPVAPTLVLYRCPDVIALERAEALRVLNAREEDPATHVNRANQAIKEFVSSLPPRTDGKPANHGWSRIEGSGSVVGPNITVTRQTSRFWRA